MDAFPQTLGRYQLKEPLAVGGMAELFIAETTGAHGFAKTVVIKRILPHLLADQQFRSMFINEAKITAQLAHPKIGQTFELGTEDNQLFIVMEYIDGVDVLALLRESARRKTKILQEFAVYIMAEVLDALDFAHALADSSGAPLGIVHRDVSPSNILLSVRGNVKLVDFGIASAVIQEQQASGDMLKGKFGYMSPEQVLCQDITPRSDLFSAGIVLAEMLIGQRLFAGKDADVMRKVRDVDLEQLDQSGKEIDPDLNTIVRKALSKQTDDRYQSAVEFRDVLHEWLFRQRKRVTNTQVAQLVKSYYDSAQAHRAKRVARLLQVSGAPGVPPPPPLEMVQPESPEGNLDKDPLTFAAGSVPPGSSEGTDDSSPFDLVISFNRQSRSPPRVENASSLAKKDSSKVSATGAQEKSGQSGTLAETPVLGLLIYFSLQKQSGKLIVTNNGERKEVVLKQGALETVSANEATDLFGAHLVREKHISSDELDMALAVLPRFDDKLGDTLVGLGLMTPPEVLEALNSQARGRLVEVCTWTEGEFEWLSEAPCPDPEFRPELDVFEAYGAGALATPRESIESWLALREQVTLDLNFKNTFPPELFQVGLGARSYLNSIDGTKTVKELAAACSLDDEGLYELRMLFLLLNAGLLKDIAT